MPTVDGRALEKRRGNALCLAAGGRGVADNGRAHMDAVRVLLGRRRDGVVPRLQPREYLQQDVTGQLDGRVLLQQLQDRAHALGHVAVVLGLAVVRGHRRKLRLFLVVRGVCGHLLERVGL